jgi:membrane protein YqaA with SNARE-associated domain
MHICIVKRQNRNIFNSFNIYYRYYKSTGLHSFVISNMIKVLIIIAIIVVVALLLNTFIIKISDIPAFLIENFPMPIVLAFFLLSESIMGMIPPDIFILWVTEMDHFYLMVGLLGIISYAGGFNAFFLGRLIRRIPKIKARTESLYADHIIKIKKWGGIFIVISAIFPIPYAIVCSLAGMLKYPTVRLAYLGIFRIARFYLYAVLINQAV